MGNGGSKLGNGVSGYPLQCRPIEKAVLPTSLGWVDPKVRSGLNMGTGGPGVQAVLLDALLEADRRATQKKVSWRVAFAVELCGFGEESGEAEKWQGLPLGCVLF